MSHGDGDSLYSDGVWGVSACSHTEWEALVFASRIPPRHHLGMETHAKREASQGPGQAGKQGDERREWERSRVTYQGAFHPGAKERGLGASTYPAVPACVGFGLWLLPSCHRFGLRTGEVKLLFWFDLGGGRLCEQPHLTELLGHLHVRFGLWPVQRRPSHAYWWSMVCKLRRYQGRIASEQTVGG